MNEIAAHEGVRVEKTGVVTTIILDSKERRNAVDGPMARALRAAFVDFEGDASQRVAVLWGDHGMFCAGADLTAVNDPMRRHELDPEGGGDGPMGPSRMALSKPLIAAVAGYAVAGGLELALLADMRVVEEGATFGVFCRRWGVPLIDGGTVRLPRLIGQSRALDLILTGREVRAEEAAAIGLANRVVPTGTARAAAIALAHEIGRFPQTCLRLDRRSVLDQWDLPLADALTAELTSGREALRADDLAVGRFVAGEGRHGTGV